MSTCTLNGGIARGCRDNAGGVYQFYMATYPTVLNVTNQSNTAGIETIIDIDTDDIGTELEFFPFIPNKNTGEFIETSQVSIENGTLGFEQKVSMIFSKMEAEKANTIKLLATGTVVIVVKDRNGKYFFVGEQDGAQ